MSDKLVLNDNFAITKDISWQVYRLWLIIFYSIAKVFKSIARREFLFRQISRV